MIKFKTLFLIESLIKKKETMFPKAKNIKKINNILNLKTQ